MWRWSVPQQPPSTFSSRQALAEVAVLGAELLRVAVVELGRLVELGMALGRGVGADAGDPAAPLARLGDDVVEVGRVGAVDHEVGGSAAGLAVDLLDRLAERLAVGQPAVGLDRERDRDRHPGGLRRARDPDRLLGVGHRHRGDHVGRGLGEGADLGRVVSCASSADISDSRLVAVAARPDDRVDHDRRLGALGLGLERLREPTASRLASSSCSAL